MRAPPFGLMTASVVVTVSAGVFATTVLPLSLEDLVERSDIVAHVRVGAVRIVQTDTAPFRATDLVVVEAFQGARSGERLELLQRGDGRVFVLGDPVLEQGEEGLAFLRRIDGNVYLTALAQSFWWIDGQGSRAMARRDLSDLAFVPAGEPRGTPPNRALWEELRESVIAACMGVSR